MLSAGQMNQEPSSLAGVLGLALLLVIYFTLGHIPPAWEGWSGWLADAMGPPFALPPNPYTLSGIVWIR